MLTVFWLENLKERDHSEDQPVDGRIILEYVWNGCIWLRIGSSGGLL
jgi:hypothetical protein